MAAIQSQPAIIASPRKARLEALTSLRFFAAVLVVMYHCGRSVEGAPFWFRGLSENGYSSVSFFFVLSGFVLAYNYLAQGQEGGMTVSPLVFWISRLARVYPVYLIALIVSLPAFIYSSFWVRERNLTAFLLAAVLLPAMLQAWVPRSALAWNAPAWSLSVEAFFYFCFPLLARFFARGNPKGLLSVSFGLVGVSTLARSLLAAQGALPNFTSFSPVFHLPSFLAGIALGRLFLTTMPDSNTANGAWFWVCFGLLCALFSFRAKLPAFLYLDIFLVPLYAMVIFAAAKAASLSEGFLANGLLVCLGDASYGLYILHVPVAFWYGWTLKTLMGLQDWMRSGLALAVYFGLVTVLSIVCYRFVEKPCRRLIRAWLEGRMNPSEVKAVRNETPEASPLFPRVPSGNEDSRAKVSL